MSDDIETLLARADKASDGVTAGPWLCDERVGCVAVYPGDRENCLVSADRWAIHYRDGDHAEPNDEGRVWEMPPQKVRDAQFIAAARTLVPELAAALRHERERAEELTGQLMQAMLDTAKAESSIDTEAIGRAAVLAFLDRPEVLVAIIDAYLKEGRTNVPMDILAALRALAATP